MLAEAGLEQAAACLQGELTQLLEVLAAEFGAITGKLQWMAGEARLVTALCRETAEVLVREEVDAGLLALRTGLGACDVQTMGESSGAILGGIDSGLERIRPLLNRLRSRPLVLRTV